jgi:hypothetical protein
LGARIIATNGGAPALPNSRISVIADVCVGRFCRIYRYLRKQLLSIVISYFDVPPGQG